MNEKLLEIIEKQSEFNLVLLNHLDAVMNRLDEIEKRLNAEPIQSS